MEGVQDYNGVNNDILVMDLHENSNINSLWLSSSSPSFHETILNFDQERHKVTRGSITKSDYNDNDNDDDQDAYQPEKKRRLSTRQVKFLEKSFDMENKLEVNRKLELAKELGLQPRQVAIWFQNRRARYKTKQEKEYASLKGSYDQLKLGF